MMATEVSVDTSESHSSLALSGSDDDEKKKAVVPRAKPKKVRSSFMGQELSNSTVTVRSRGSLMKSRDTSLTLTGKDSFGSIAPVTERASHKEQLINLMSRFRGLEEGG